MAAKVYHIFGLGYGDEGKGTIIDALVRKQGAVAVVRYNGGPQAAHHVVDTNGRWHCFSQFGSGTLVDGVKTHLASGMLVKPSNLLAEASWLQAIGVPNPLKRITISPECFLATPLHAMIGQMLEASRGQDGHGSVGMGVGQAAFDRANWPKKALKVRDLMGAESALLAKLDNHFQEKYEQAQTILEQASNVEVVEIYNNFKKRLSVAQMSAEYREFVTLFDRAFVADEIALPHLASQGAVVLEGAQGILLDPGIGFAPFVTKTRVLPDGARYALELLNVTDSVVNIGVSRAFATRHGAGPLVTEQRLPYLTGGEHNQYNRWQGDFRYGWLDLVALRYSLSSVDSVNYLAVTCLDRLNDQAAPICTSYQYCGEVTEALSDYFEWDKLPDSRVRIRNIKPSNSLDTQQLQQRTAMLLKCQPLYGLEPFGWQTGQGIRRGNSSDNALKLIEYLQSREVLDTPVAITSIGPTADGKHFLLDI